ncbi:6-carboxytetrahydropterin synthase QueD [Desulfothermobacter acidiphilus]|uniref:6-carboxytetrahydropterin synthase QueD n=1 Tax=Desulfothermobacter acidiphilus TaxID=1938353 RepID=UPI003F8CBE38
MYRLTVKDTFAAAHRLPDHPSPCHRLHGHNWEVNLTVVGEELGPDGMLLDFGVLKRILREVLSSLDHQYLNEIPPFGPAFPPTAENLARHIYHEVSSRLAPYTGVTLLEVKVGESPSAWVVYAP